VANVKAVILAAGRGVRMGRDQPKTIIPVRGNEPLIYYLMEGLKKAGIDDLMVVTGYKPTAVQDYVNQHWEGETQFVFNARFASWGNFHSLRMGLDQAPGFDVMVVNCDIVIHPDVFDRVLGTEGDLVLAVERRDDLDDEDMRVRLQGRRVVDIGKSLKRAHSHGEFDGVSLIRPAAVRAYMDESTTLEWRADTELYYEDVYRRILDRVDARAAFVERGEYAEVDVWSDMEVAAAVLRRHEDAWTRPQAAV
jgi:choline kinase